MAYILSPDSGYGFSQAGLSLIFTLDTKKEDSKDENSQNAVSVDWVFALGLFFLGMYVSILAVQSPAYLKNYLALDPKIVGNVSSVFATLKGLSVFGLLIDNMGYNTSWIFVLSFIVIRYVSLITASIGITKLNKERIAKLKAESKDVA